MAKFSRDAFQGLRPILYHVTATENVSGIRCTRTLHSPIQISSEYGRATVARGANDQVSGHDGNVIRLGDQYPLLRAKGQICFIDGWNFAQYLRELNRRVFFFPGANDEPLNCKRFVKSKISKNICVKILRIPTRLLFDDQGDPEFCRYNSGAPRMSNGRRSPRGPNTFVREADVHFAAYKVQEVTFLDSVRLPQGTEIKAAAGWRDFV